MQKSIVIVVLAIVVSCCGFAGIVQADLSDGLVAYYPFNGKANDESGNGNHGTVNGATLAEDRFGNVDSAYNFDGVNDYITISNNTIGHLSEGAISMFIYFPNFLDNTSNGQWILTSDPVGDTDGHVSFAFDRSNCGNGPSLSSIC